MTRSQAEAKKRLIDRIGMHLDLEDEITDVQDMDILGKLCVVVSIWTKYLGPRNVEYLIGKRGKITFDRWTTTGRRIETRVGDLDIYDVIYLSETEIQVEA